MIQAGKGHRFVVIFRGAGLEGPILVPILNGEDFHRQGDSMPVPESSKGRGSDQYFYEVALPLLKDEQPANGFLMRGIAHQPDIPTFQERYRLKPACLAVYPMYKGLAQLVGMTKIEGPQTIGEQFNRYLELYDDYDFFFIHYKYTDMYEEDEF